jgi:hypothetical protein
MLAHPEVSHTKSPPSAYFKRNEKVLKIAEKGRVNQPVPFVKEKSDGWEGPGAKSL